MKENKYLNLIWDFDRFADALKEAGMCAHIADIRFLREAIKQRAVGEAVLRAAQQIEVQTRLHTEAVD